MTTVMEQPITPLMRELNRLLTHDGNAFAPPADVLVDDDGVTVHLDVPGLHADNLEIELESGVLTVRGERPFPYQPENGDKTSWRRIERPFGRFERSLRVPRGLEADAIEATLHDGVLTLRIPKPEQLRPRRITIAEAAE
jgi:HSP20 family protein